jgi:hypothetical protein
MLKDNMNGVGKATAQALAHRQGIQSICDHFPACNAGDEQARERSVNYEGMDRLIIMDASK